MYKKSFYTLVHRKSCYTLVHRKSFYTLGYYYKVNFIVTTHV